jgi:hypothetical protein
MRLEKEVEWEMRWQRKDIGRYPKPFVGHEHGPTVCFTPALTPRSFPTHDWHGNCPTTLSIFTSRENRGAVGEHQSQCMTRRVCEALTCLYSGVVPGLAT